MANHISPVESKPSSILSLDENDQLFKLIGLRCKSMASAVVQVCFADPPNRSQWNKRHCGVVCFIKDNIKRSYFLRVFCLDRQSAIWEQELYSSFDYCAPRPYFHTFEGDECRIGFNFANEGEAEYFLMAIKEYLRMKSEKRERRRLSQQQVQQPQPGKHTPVATNGSVPKSTAVRSATITNRITVTKKGKKDKNKKITKADIGGPSDFKHISHVGWDPNQGFALDNVDPNLLKFFARAGISENHLKDKATREFIYDFIDKHGGKEAAIREISSLQSSGGSLFSAPPVPARNPPSTPQTARIAPPAPPVSAPPPPPSRVIASPPSVAPPAPPQRAPPPKMAPINNVAPPPPPVGAPPPPPPPPPPPSFGGPPAPPVPSFVVSSPSLPPTPAQPDVRGALMDAIKEGHKLKSVPSDADQSMKSGAKVPAFDSRNDLLGQIRAGKELKPVEKKASVVAVSDDVMEGMAGALARALEERCRVIHSDSDESGQDPDEDDDWDD
ncbi:neural Wiskott-Aldrich syndrome protein-like [Daphnia pulex]|uniref:neural Wiskott-Aldrich syndrome protein-like n=1 Tax=Daphnia pulex TaxID=6669 RepID=UPI001EE0DE07|nr:neural Wiskott-Aldrich syndrome protein-like [Daphnia pulex]